MKLKTNIILAVAALVHGFRREVLAANTYDAAVKTHPSTVQRTNDAAVTTRHLLWKQGSTDGGIALCAAANVPLGTVDIPLAWRDYTARHAQWVIDHAAWVTEHATWADGDPETRGDEPVEPIEPEKRTTWKIQWDVVFFSDEWQAWLDAKELHDAWEVEHQAWEDCTEDCGLEPPEPPEEGAEPTPPTFMEDDLFWEYTGLGNPEESDWYQLELLDGVNGQTRIVNIQYICWESERHGVKPTLYGEIYNHDDYVDGE